MRNRVLFALTLLLVAGLVFAGGGQEKDQAEPPATDEATTDAPSDSQDQTGAAGTPITSNDPEGAAATVNGVAIPREDYENAVTQTRRQYETQGQPVANEEEFRSQVLDQLIAEELLYQEALSRGLEAGETQIESQFEQIRSQFETDEEWRQALERNGTTEETLRAEIERNAVIQQLIADSVEGTAEVTDEEVQTFYDENPQYFEQGEQIAARHILISTQELESDEEIEAARERAESIRRELLNGADFATLARERSEGPTAPQGGDLGTFGRGQMVGGFEEAAFALEEGEISEVVQTQFGFHVIQVTEKLEGGKAPIQEVAPTIREYLGQQKQGETLSNYVETLRSEAEVDVNVNE